MATFVKYASIENSYRDKAVKELRDGGWLDKEWLVMEKAHGANFSFIVTKDDIAVASRNRLLVTEKDRLGFYNAETVMKKYSSAARQLFDRVQCSQVVIFGELLGGFYPGESVEGAKIVQKGIVYCPHNDFIAFDIMVDDVYMDYDTACQMLGEASFLYFPVLYRGCFDDAIQWSNSNKASVSQVCSMFNLPLVDSNIMEGHVLKTACSSRRLKNKNDKFEERNGAQQQLRCLDDAERYLTQNRLDALVSKGLNTTDRDTLARLLIADALEDWRKDTTWWAGMTRKQKSLLTKHLMKKAMEIVETNL